MVMVQGMAKEETLAIRLSRAWHNADAKLTRAVPFFLGASGKQIWWNTGTEDICAC